MADLGLRDPAMTATAPPPVLPVASGSSSPSPWRQRAARYPALTVAAAIAVVTLLSAIAAAIAPQLGPATSPHATLHGTPAEAVAIFGHNARTLVAPLLLCAGRWHTGRVTRHLGDLLVAALVVANAALVGAALGRYPAELPAYLLHMPLEDAAVAIAAGAWLGHRLPRRAGVPAPNLAWAATLTLVVAIAAAIIETYAVPHKG
jgi:hypothetical protein